MAAEPQPQALDRGRPRQQLRIALTRIRQLELPLVAVWLGAAFGLAALTTRVVDWYVMTDELLYERLAISIGRLHSPLPHVHGVLIPNVNQLYPLLLAPLFTHGYVPRSLHDAHLLNAFVMSSAAIPAFLLARRVTQRAWTAYLAAVLTVCLPWLVLSSFLLTEVAAYPAFLWALLAFQRALTSPSRSGDILALVGLALAVSARTQFVILGLVLPLAILAIDGRRGVERHRLLGWAYAVLAAGMVVLLAVGRLASTLGTYAGTVSGNLLPSDSGRSLLEHVAVLALGLGILPLVLGVAWMLARLVRAESPEARVFAVLGVITLAGLLLEVTLFDLRFGNGIARDRYLFYVAPVVLVAFTAALLDLRLPHWALLTPTAVAALGFAVARLPRYDKLSVDSPVAVLNNYLVRTGHSVAGARITLVVATVLLSAVFLQARAILPRTILAATLAAVTTAALTAETAYAFDRLFRVNGTSGRPVTLDQGVVFNWIDREALTPSADVTMVPYPMLPGDYWASVAYWWDLEFWNRSVDRAAYYPKQFEGTPSTFPKVYLHFDPRTGAANHSPGPYVVQSAGDTRFRVSGNVQYADRNALLIEAGKRWRTDWLSYGLYDDGWTRPGRAVRIRIFAVPGQPTALTRTLTLALHAPDGVAARPFAAVSDDGAWRGTASDTGTAVGTVQVCVPRTGFTEVRLTARGASIVYGDLRDPAGGLMLRRAGVFLAEIALADEVGSACTAEPSPRSTTSG